MARQLTSAQANTAAAFAAVLFGASVVGVRIAVRDVPPLTLAFLRFSQGAVVLALGMTAFRRDLFRVARRDVPYLVLLGLVFYAIFAVSFNAGLKYLEASTAALLIATMPLWTLLITRAVIGTRLVARQVAGVFVGLGGVAIVMVDRGLGQVSAIGVALLSITALCGAAYNILAKRMLVKYDALTVTFYAMLFGSLILTPSLVGWNAAALSRETMTLVAFLGIVGGAVAFGLWTIALRRLSPTEVAVYINLNPMSASLLAAAFLGERLTPAFALGFIAVAAGVLIVNWSGRATQATR